MTIAIAQFTACSSGVRTPAIPGANASASGEAVRSQTVTSADFESIAAWGTKGQLAIAQCPQGYEVIAGGSSSSNGSFVGTGYPTTTHNAWVTKPASDVLAEAFATCVSHALAREDFRWRSAGATSGIAGAQCRSGYTLITGYAVGSVSASWYDTNTNTYWVTGGETAYASCVRGDAGIVIKHAWNQSQKPKDVYAGCGRGYTVIGGAMGNGQWPGPPIQEHPGDATAPSAHGNHGWWTFSNAQNELTWAACVKAS